MVIDKEWQHSDSSEKRINYIWKALEQTDALLDMHKKKKTGCTVGFGVPDGGFGEMGRRGLKFTDEPTGNLDTENEEKIVELLASLAHEKDFTVIMVTHNRQIADRADVRLVMKDGRMTETAMETSGQ